VRVEAVVDGSRYHVSGTVLGHRHGRLVELDDTPIDAIPEPPLLVTWHRDAPGVLGAIGTLLGELGVNIERMQLGAPAEPGRPALGIWNLDRPLDDDDIGRLQQIDVIEAAVQVR